MRLIPIAALAISYSAGLTAQTPPLWSATRDLRIGDLDDPNFAFTWMQGITQDRAGNIYSLHYEERTVRRFDAAGKPLGKFGRRGEGPGEFSNPAHLGWRGDSLWVYDSVRRRFHLFASDGRVLATITVLPEGADPRSRQPASPRGLLNDGSVLGQMSLGAVPAPFQSGGTAERSALVRMNRQGHILDTLTVYTSLNTFLRVADPNGRWNRVFGNPFGVSTLYAPAADGASVFLVERPIAENARQGSFTVRRLGVNGDTIYSHRHTYTPERVTKPHSDSALEANIRSMSVAQGSQAPLTTRAAAQKLIHDAIKIPDFHPPVQEIVAGLDGTLWLRREDLWRPTNSWLVLDGGGRAIGQVELPRRIRVMSASRTVVLAQEFDELDVVYITRYRIAPSR